MILYAGWDRPPPERMTPAQLPSYFDRTAAEADRTSTEPTQDYGEPDPEDLIQEDINSVLELHSRAERAWQQAVQARSQRANPRRTSTPARTSAGADRRLTKPLQNDHVEGVAPDPSTAARQPPAASRDKAVTRRQQNKRAGKTVEGREQQQQHREEATASAWDYPQQPATRRRRASRKDVVDLTEEG